MKEIKTNPRISIFLTTTSCNPSKIRKMTADLLLSAIVNFQKRNLINPDSTATLTIGHPNFTTSHALHNMAYFKTRAYVFFPSYKVAPPQLIGSEEPMPWAAHPRPPPPPGEELPATPSAPDTSATVQTHTHTWIMWASAHQVSPNLPCSSLLPATETDQKLPVLISVTWKSHHTACKSTNTPISLLHT